MQEIETKEIKGVSFKTLASLVVATATICITVISTTSAISSQVVKVDTKVEKVQMQVAGDNKLTDLRITIMEKRLDIIDAILSKLNNK